MIPVIIPSYEPDEKLVLFIDQLLEYGNENIVIINDGSEHKYDKIFHELEKRNVIILKHAVNQGKGRALKTAFNYCINEFPDLVGCVTADSDGQHSVEDIYRCIDMLKENETSLILGCRNFDLPYIPSKSKFGNKITRGVCKYICGINISDTQTGLRGIPRAFMEDLLNVTGERFEFETNMLIESKEKYPIIEIEIETIYDSKDNHVTHFDPIKDSIKIYRIFGRIFLKFIISSLSSSIVDLVMFSILCGVLKSRFSIQYIAIATVLARIVSATYNYIINYKVVFKSKENHFKSTVKYILLAIIQVSLSALLVSVGALLLSKVPEVGIKIVVDTFLFLVSFYVQREIVFKK